MNIYRVVFISQAKYKRMANDRPYDARESRQIGQILNGMAEWECVGAKQLARYGIQRCWMRIQGDKLRRFS